MILGATGILEILLLHLSTQEHVVSLHIIYPNGYLLYFFKIYLEAHLIPTDLPCQQIMPCLIIDYTAIGTCVLSGLSLTIPLVF